MTKPSLYTPEGAVEYDLHVLLGVPFPNPLPNDVLERRTLGWLTDGGRSGPDEGRAGPIRGRSPHLRQTGSGPLSEAALSADPTRSPVRRLDPAGGRGLGPPT